MSKKKQKQIIERVSTIQPVKRKKGRPRKIFSEQTQSNSSYSSHQQDVISKVLTKAIHLRNIQTLHQLYTQMTYIKHYVWKSWLYGELSILPIKPTSIFLTQRSRQVLRLK